MIEKVSLSSNNKSKYAPCCNNAKAGQNPSFSGMGDFLIRGVQACEREPMINVTVLDLSTAIIPRTFFETFIGSEQKDENGNKKKRKLNLIGGFEALRREGSGLLINCIIPSFIVMGAAKLLNRPIMGDFNKSSLVKCWANGDAIDKIEKYYKAADGTTNKEKVFNTLKSMINDMEGVDGDISQGGLKKFKDIFTKDSDTDAILHEITDNIVKDKPNSKAINKSINKLIDKTGISENIRFNGETGFSSNSFKSLMETSSRVLHGVVKEDIKDTDKLSKYFSKARTLVNAKSILGLGIIIPLAIAAQPINRWITHKISGKKGAPLYNDDKERVLTPEEKTKLTTQKCFAVPLMAGVAGLSMLMDRPSLKMFQFKNIFPTMDQARIISAATFSSRIAAAEDSNELKENTIRDIATFSSFYFLGDYAAKGIATFLEKCNKDVKLINRLKPADKDANIFKKFWNWAKHTNIKSSDELNAIKDTALRTKSKNLRTICQIGNIAFSLLSLGIFIPLYTRTQTNKKELAKRKAVEAERKAASFTAANDSNESASSTNKTYGRTSSSPSSSILSGTSFEKFIKS